MATICPALERTAVSQSKVGVGSDELGASVGAEGGGGLLERTRLGRQQAEALLRSLMAAKADCEGQLRRFKRADAMRSVTGRSAFDSAINSTRSMIEALDRALATQCGPVGA